MKRCDVPYEKLKTRKQIRQHFGDIDELAQLIDSSGFIYPLLITESYDIIAGERRWRAVGQLREQSDTQENRFATIPCLIYEGDDEERINLQENLGRKNLTIYEMGTYFAAIADSRMVPHAVIARENGIGVSTVSCYIRVVKKCHPDILAFLERGGDIPARHLLRWSGRDHDTQKEEFESWRLGKKQEQRKKRQMIRYSVAERLVTSLQRREQTEKVRVALETARYLMGISQKRPQL